MNKSSSKKSILLYSVHLPLLVALLVSLLIGFGAVAKTVSVTTAQTVLSDDDEWDDEEDSDDDEDDEDENDSEDRGDSEHEDEDSEDSDSEDENDEEEDVDEEDVDEDDRDDDGHEIEFEYKSDDNSNPELNNLIEAEFEQEIETNERLGTTVNKVELEVETVNGKYEYEGTTFKDGKLFGLFDISIPMGIEIDPATGQIISVNQTFWSKLLAFFSTN